MSIPVPGLRKEGSKIIFRFLRNSSKIPVIVSVSRSKHCAVLFKNRTCICIVLLDVSISDSRVLTPIVFPSCACLCNINKAFFHITRTSKCKYGLRTPCYFTYIWLGISINVGFKNVI